MKPTDVAYIQHIDCARTLPKMQLKFVSGISRGLNNLCKRTTVIRDLKKLRGDILLVQETHFVTQDSFRHQDKLLPHIFSSTPTCNKRRGFDSYWGYGGV